jgi:hypothetical protein
MQVFRFHSQIYTGSVYYNQKYFKVTLEIYWCIILVTRVSNNISNITDFTTLALREYIIKISQHSYLM